MKIYGYGWLNDMGKQKKIAYEEINSGLHSA